MTATKAAQMMAAVNKSLGTEALFLGSDQRLVREQIPTGVLPVDALTAGGFPRGRFVELFGPHSTLKSWIALQSIVQVQQNGGVAALADTEHAYDPEWAELCGVKTGELLLVEGETGEEKLDTAEVMIRQGLDLLVVDSIAALLPQQEHGKRLHREGVQPGRTAALMSLASRKLTAANSRTCLVWINQMREQIGITFGPTEKTTGGRAMGFYASLRIKVTPAGKITEPYKVHTGEKWTDAKALIAQTYRLTVEKSRITGVPQGCETLFDWSVKTGEIDIIKYVFAQCVELDALTNRGASWSYENVKVVGRENFQTRMRQDALLMARMTNTVRQRYRLPIVLPPQALAPASTSRGRQGLRKKTAGV